MSSARDDLEEQMTVTRVLARVLAAVLLLVLAAPWAWRTATGDFYMTVQGRSMTPTYQVGDVLVVQEPDGDELTRAGQVVVAALGAPGADGTRMYVHRVVEPLPDGGAWLQGDGNDARDPRPVTQDEVLGTPRLVLAGPVAAGFRASQTVAGRLVLGAVALTLLLLPLRGRAGEPEEPGEDPATP